VCTISLRISIQIFCNIKHHAEGEKEELLLKSDTMINSMILTGLKFIDSIDFNSKPSSKDKFFLLAEKNPVA